MEWFCSRARPFAACRFIQRNGLFFSPKFYPNSAIPKFMVEPYSDFGVDINVRTSSGAGGLEYPYRAQNVFFIQIDATGDDWRSANATLLLRIPFDIPLALGISVCRG